MADRVRPEVADGAPIDGDLVAVIDESSPQNAAGGVTYVVAIAAVFDPGRALASLDALFTAERRRLFHWEREGTVARTRIIEIAADIGVVATAHYAHVGRRGQSRARQAMLAEMVRDVAALNRRWEVLVVDKPMFLTVPEVMARLRLSRTTVYEQARLYLATGGDVPPAARLPHAQDGRRRSTARHRARSRASRREQ